MTVDAGARTPTTRRRIVAEAWLLNAVNPKGTAFMLAVVPQFLTPGEPLVPQYLVDRRDARASPTSSSTPATRRSPRACSALLRTPARLRTVNRVFGGLFVALGVLLATFKRA